MTTFEPGDIKFAAAYNNLSKFPTLTKVAESLEVSVKTVKARALALRLADESDKAVPKLINRTREVRGLNPMSESAEKFKEDWKADDCIAELRKLAEANPDKVISRNFFRVHSQISESTWNRFFGTFHEFKRQAGIVLTRQQHAVERHIAHHASVDHYRRMGAARTEYAENYLRDKKSKHKIILVGSDLHDKECDPFWLSTFIDTAKRVQPDVINLNGDIFDLPEFGKYTVDPRDWDVVGRIKFVHDQILRPLREACPDSQIDFIEGNHEARLLRHLADAAPALRAVLSDLHGFTVSKLFGLDEFEVNYIAKADLASWDKRSSDKELAKNYRIYWDTLVAHHFPYGRHLGLPGWNGHHHKHELWSGYSPHLGPFEWHQLGCGHVREASYAEGEKWANGFLLAHLNTVSKSTCMEYIQVQDFAMVGGKIYSRPEAYRRAR